MNFYTDPSGLCQHFYLGMQELIKGAEWYSMQNILS